MSHTPSEARTTLQPIGGSCTVLHEGTHDTTAPQSPSPTPRTTASPPGHARRSPNGLPSAFVPCLTSTPGSALTLSISSGLSIMRCEVDRVTGLSPNSDMFGTRMAKVSPTLAQVTSRRVALTRQTVTVEPESGLALRHLSCSSLKASVHAARMEASSARSSLAEIAWRRNSWATVEAASPLCPSAMSAAVHSSFVTALSKLRIACLSSFFFGWRVSAVACV
mmetsp:Transcript_21224/g.66479  ORF Transcript_21224/g.66479 Transcript_21224/m.66479 type:complete len:222 (-) Transcript_21224:129-794(-)